MLPPAGASVYSCHLWRAICWCQGYSFVFKSQTHTILITCSPCIWLRVCIIYCKLHASKLTLRMYPGVRKSIAYSLIHHHDHRLEKMRTASLLLAWCSFCFELWNEVTRRPYSIVRCTHCESRSFFFKNVTFLSHLHAIWFYHVCIGGSVSCHCMHYELSCGSSLNPSVPTTMIQDPITFHVVIISQTAVVWHYGGDPVSVPASEWARGQEAPGDFGPWGGPGTRHRGQHERNSLEYWTQVLQHDGQLHVQPGGGGWLHRHHGPPLRHGRLIQGRVRAWGARASTGGGQGWLWGDLQVLLCSSNGCLRYVSHRGEASRGANTSWGRRINVFILAPSPSPPGFTLPGWIARHNNGRLLSWTISHFDWFIYLFI